MQRASFRTELCDLLELDVPARTVQVEDKASENNAIVPIRDDVWGARVPVAGLAEAEALE